MRRLSLAILLLCGLLSFGADAQLGGGLMFPGPGTPAATSGCSQSTAYLARTSGLSGTESAAMVTMICGLVTDGTYSIIPALYIYAINSTTTANLNVTNNSGTFNQTVSGTCTFTADQGYTGDASTCYFDTGLTPSTTSGLSQNSISVAVYDRTSSSSGTFNDNLGSVDTGATTNITISAYIVGGTINFTIDDASFLTAPITNIQGFWVLSRTASATSNLFMNGVAYTGSPFSATSTGIPNQTIVIMATKNFSGSIVAHSADQLAAAFVGQGLTTGQMASVSARINAYMTAVGANVY